MKIIQHNANKSASKITIRHIYEQLEKNPRNIKLNVAMAYLNRKSGSLEHALFFCKNALTIDQYDYHALYEQARIFALQNSHALACKNYQIIYSHHKNEYEYLQDWCQCLIYLNNKKYIDKFEVICIELINKFKNSNDLATITCYEQLELINPQKVNYTDLKDLYLKTNQYNKSEKIILDELNKNPNSASHLINYAAFLHDTNRLDEALIACNQAIAIDPNYYYAYDRLSFVLKELNDPIGSKNAILKCLDLNSTDSTLFHLATTELLLGNYETGWALYKYHNSVAKPNTPHFIPELLFDGTQNLKDKVLCVWLDLGLGDAIKFVRYIPMLAKMVQEQGGTMICSIFSEFNNFFHKNYSRFFTEIANRFYKPYEEFDYQIQVSRFPELFKTTIETIPNKIPYLQPSEQAIIKYKDILKHDNNFKVGLVWAGNKNHSRDHIRSIPVDSYIPFKDIDNISFYGLQFGKSQDIDYARSKGLNIIDLTPDIKNFDESAVIFQQLDLLITVDTSACHLAGALGVPTWLLIDIAPHYVWLLNREDSPWYPNTTLYRQTEYKNWQPILKKMHEDLAKKVKNRIIKRTSYMYETSKSIMRRLHDSRFISKYFIGSGIDIGAGADGLSSYQHLFPQMKACYDWDQKDGDAQLMEKIQSESLDFAHSSHCLEHLYNPFEAIENWLRILKPNGHLIVTIPDEDMYEQGIFPSTFNTDHKHTFTISKPKSWTNNSINILSLLEKFSHIAQIIKIEQLDSTFKFNQPRYDQTLNPIAECAIEFILRKKTQEEIDRQGLYPKN